MYILISVALTNNLLIKKGVRSNFNCATLNVTVAKGDIPVCCDF